MNLPKTFGYHSVSIWHHAVDLNRYVGNLPSDTTEVELIHLFESEIKVCAGCRVSTYVTA